MQFGWLFGSLLPFLIAGCTSPTDAQHALDGIAFSALSARGVPGVGISVWLPDGTSLSASAGGISPGGADPYTVDGSEQLIGSLTKLYIATMIMQLVEGGQLSLDDTASEWVTLPQGDLITVRMLLNHTSGLADCVAGMTPEELRQAWTPLGLLDRAIARGAVSDPGGPLAVYSNTNFLVLAMILESVTGDSWTNALGSRIAGPLGLVHTSSATLPAAAASIIPGWAMVDGVWHSTLGAIDPSIGWGYGSMTSTNEELMRFARAFFGGQLFQDVSTLESMMRFDVEVDPATLGGQPPTRVGLAVHQFTIGDVVLEGHLGHIYGYDTALVRDPSNGAIIVVTVNSEQTGAAGLTAYDVASYLRASR